MSGYSLETVAARAGVDPREVARLTELGILAGGTSAGYTDADVRRRPVKWLGDGLMFHFPEPPSGVLAAVEMVSALADEGLPPAHVGLHQA